MLSFAEDDNFNLVCEGRQLIKNVLNEEYVSESFTKKTYVIENGYWDNDKAVISSNMILLSRNYNKNKTEINIIASIDRLTGDASEIMYTKNNTNSLEFKFTGNCVNLENKLF